MKDKGTVYWFTGLAGAGKTTISKLFYNKLKQVKDNVVFLDGDILREVFGSDLGYTIEERKISAMRNSKICKILSEQGIDVVCATISMINECREWNLINVQNFKEIYLFVPIDILVKRDQKNLYSKALNGEIKNVMGIDIIADEPLNPTMKILNDGNELPNDIANKIFNKLLKGGY